jgi:hypothetical protein
LFLSVIGAVGAYVALRLDTRRHRTRMVELEHVIESQKNQISDMQTRMLLLLADNSMMRNEFDRLEAVIRAIS